MTLLTAAEPVSIIIISFSALCYSCLSGLRPSHHSNIRHIFPSLVTNCQECADFTVLLHSSVRNKLLVDTWSRLSRWINDTFEEILREFGFFHSLILSLSVFSFLLSEIRELTYFWSAIWRQFTRVSLRPHCVLARAEPPCPLTDGWAICCYLPVFCSGMLLNNGTHVGNVDTGMSRDKNGNCSHFLLHSVAKCVEMCPCSRPRMNSIRFFIGHF